MGRGKRYQIGMFVPICPRSAPPVLATAAIVLHKYRCLKGTEVSNPSPPAERPLRTGLPDQRQSPCVVPSGFKQGLPRARRCDLTPALLTGPRLSSTAALEDAVEETGRPIPRTRRRFGGLSNEWANMPRRRRSRQHAEICCPHLAAWLGARVPTGIIVSLCSAMSHAFATVRAPR